MMFGSTRKSFEPSFAAKTRSVVVALLVICCASSRLVAPGVSCPSSSPCCRLETTFSFDDYSEYLLAHQAVLNCVATSSQRPCPLCGTSDPTKTADAAKQQAIIARFASFWDRHSCWDGQIAFRSAASALAPRNYLASEIACGGCNATAAVPGAVVVSCAKYRDSCLNLWRKVNSTTFSAFAVAQSKLAICGSQVCPLCGERDPTATRAAAANQFALDVVGRVIAGSALGDCWGQPIARTAGDDLVLLADSKNDAMRAMFCGGCDITSIAGPNPPEIDCERDGSCGRNLTYPLIGACAVLALLAAFFAFQWHRARATLQNSVNQSGYQAVGGH